jgi:multiple sugar transport system permease protein
VAQHGWPLLLVTPVLALIVGLIYGPLAYAFQLSLTNTSLIRVTSAFVGLENYSKAFTSPEFWSIAGQTLAWALISAAGAATLGLTAATLLSSVRLGRPIRGKALIGGILLIPFVTPPVVVAYTWNYLYSTSGPLNGILSALGQASPIAFTGDTSASPLGLALPMWSLIQVGVWSGFPFYFLMCSAAMTSIPQNVLEAALIDGASSWRTFWSIIIPMIAPVLEITLFLDLLFRFGGLDLPFLLTGGGPLNKSNVWGVFIYQVGFQRLDVGYGAALGIMLFLIAAPFAILYVRRSRRKLQEA